MGLSTSPGRGTSQTKKQRGKSARLKEGAPNERIKEPIHHATSASMRTESCSSGRRATRPSFAIAVIRAAEASKIAPKLKLNAVDATGDFQSRKINATLTGMMSKMCVY